LRPDESLRACPAFAQRTMFALRHESVRRVTAIDEV